jgi:hypothetical protein
MPDVQQIIDSLGCFTTKNHPCVGCAYNPHPGMAWPYGCIAGQRRLIEDAKTELAKQNREIGSLMKYVMGRGGRVIKNTEVDAALRVIEEALDTLTNVGNGVSNAMLHETANRIFGLRYFFLKLFKPDDLFEDCGKEFWEELTKSQAVGRGNGW